MASRAKSPDPAPPGRARRASIHKWVRRGFLVWAVVSTLWLANSFRTQGVGERLLQDGPGITIVDGPAALEMLPESARGAALIFICGAGVSARAYAPLLRPIAEAGYPVIVVRLPLRFAPLEKHKRAAVDRTLGLRAAHPDNRRWVIAGHSLGGALACRVIQAEPDGFAGMVLIGTTHPKTDDLSSLKWPVTKVYATNDGVAPMEWTLANKALLPARTRWVEIAGGNHSQFGHYGRQLFDGAPTITREAQQEATRAALLDALAEAAR